MNRKVIFSVLILLVLSRCSSDSSDDNRTSGFHQKELYINLEEDTITNAQANSFDDVEVYMTTNFPIGTVIIIETGDTEDLSNTAHSFRRDSLNLISQNHSISIPKSFFPAYLKFQILKENQEASNLKQIFSLLKNHSNGHQKPLGENNTCIFETIFMLKFDAKQTIQMEKQYVGVRME